MKSKFNYLSPDGFHISMEDFNTKEEADAYMNKWLKRFEHQGYYSTMNLERIPLNEIKDRCRLVTE